MLAAVNPSGVCSPGPQPGLVPSDAGHVPGEQRCGRGAERDPQPAGEAGVHHEAGVQPVRTADGAQRAGGFSCNKKLMGFQYGC